ncbi:MAG: protein-disulfide reductase DsbD family protein [Henriciella sp.]|nr:protein-disulfide reductase DsbD family protein [Henriciella sp.]
MTVAFRFVCLLPVLAMAALFAPAKAQPVDGGHARVELVSERAIAVPGETVWFGLSFEIDPNWHIYWLNAGDAGIPPAILWADSLAVSEDAIGPFQWPVPELLPIVPNEIMDYGYSDRVVLPFAVEISEDAQGPILFEGIADYLICENICIPESAPIRLLQSVGAEQVPDSYGGDLIIEALGQIPPELDGAAALTQSGETWTLSVATPQLAGRTGEARFFPNDHDIKHAADQPVSFGPEGLQLELTPARSTTAFPEMLSGVVTVGEAAVAISATPGAILPGTSDGGTLSAPAINLPVLIILAMIGGLILNLMPCVLPVLSIKAMGLVSAAASGNGREARAHGLWYTAGVVLSFAALAAAIVGVRAATGIATWGFWLQDPLVVTALILIIFLIGLWLLGMFELGSSVQNVGGSLAQKQGPAGAFFTGVLAAIVGAPCTGPFLGAAIGTIMGQPAPQVFLVLIAMGLGMALPFLALSFMPSLQRLLPKPGAWMETLKQVFAFPMFLTAAWLLSVLGALAGYRMAAMVVAGAALIAFGIWALKSAGQGGRAILIAVLGLITIIPVFELMGALSATDTHFVGVVRALAQLLVMAIAIWVVARLSTERAGLIARIGAVLALVAGLVLPVVQARSALAVEGGSEAYAAVYQTEAWSPERVSELVAEGRPIFIDFTAEWCATCQANKLQTLQTKPVTEAFEAGNVAFLVADYTRPDPLIAAELQKHNRAGVPMYLWYPPGDSEPQVLPEVLSIDLVTGLVEAG